MTTIELQSTLKMPLSPTPIVIIGAGGIVNDAHLPAYCKAGFPVAGIFDLDEAKARQTADAFAVETVFPSVDAAVGALGSEAVYDVALPASVLPKVLPGLPDGVGVLIQKPMGENLNEARTIREICRAKSLRASINFQLRYAPYVLAAHSLIEQGAIGDLVGIEVNVAVFTPWGLWPFLERVPCMEVKYHSIHYLDLMRAFVGDPQGIYAKITNHPAAPNMQGTRSAMILDYGDQLRSTINTNHFFRFGTAHQESAITWEGTSGVIKASMGLLKNYPNGEPDRFEVLIEGGVVQGEMVAKVGDGGGWQHAEFSGTWFPDAFIGTMADLMRYVEGSADHLPTGVEDAYHTMALVDAACRSSEGGATPIRYA